MSRRREKACSSGKVPMEHGALRGRAASLARTLNAEGQLAPSFYAYRCSECHAWHLTKRAAWKGVPNELVHEAAPEALQQWAMTGVMPERPQVL